MTSSLSRKTKKSLIFLCFIVLGSLFFFHFAQANAGGEGGEGMFSGAGGTEATAVSLIGFLRLMFTPVGNVIIALITAAFQLLLALAQIGLDIAVWLLSRVTHPDFISLSYTNPAGNPLLATGWTLIRNLTNMGFVISFAFIGLATALRIKEYQAQKLLPSLILMALLVNFTPVILGVIVDASNILMNFLLGEVANFQFIADMWSAQKNIALGQLKAITGETINYRPLAATITLIVFALTTQYIILLYILLFLFRYVAIWILVILSPLAFFCYVLPVTRKFWSQWWNQFFQWCFIGVTMAFFLYLSNHLLVAANQGKITSAAPSEAWGFVETFLPYGMVIALLIYGLLMGLKSSAVGAEFAIKAAKWTGRTAKKAGIATGRETWRRVEEKAKLPEAAERVGRWAATKPVLGTIVGLPLKGYAERYREKFEEGEKKYKNWKSKDIAASLDRLPEPHRAAGLKIIAERGHFEDIKKAGYEISAEKRKKILEIAKRLDKHKDVLKFMPQHAPDIGEKIEDAIKWQKPSDVEKLDKSVFGIGIDPKDTELIRRAEEVRKAMIYTYSREKWKKLYHQGPEVIGVMQETLEKEYRESPDELIKRNSPLLRYTHSQAAQGIWKAVGDLDEIKRKEKGIPPKPKAVLVGYKWVWNEERKEWKLEKKGGIPSKKPAPPTSRVEELEKEEEEKRRKMRERIEKLKKRGEK